MHAARSVGFADSLGCAVGPLGGVLGGHFRIQYSILNTQYSKLCCEEGRRLLEIIRQYGDEDKMVGIYNLFFEYF